MKKQVSQMKELNKAFGDYEQESPNIVDVPAKYKSLRIKLMQSELDEIKHAIENNDLENLAEEIGDLLYTVIGTATTFGLGEKLEKIFDETHQNNMSKIWPDGKPHLTPEGKILKPETYKKKEFKKIIESEDKFIPSLDNAQARILKYSKARGWFPQEPVDLAKSIVIESAELLEHFQWDSTNKSQKPKNWEEIQNELADVFIYMLAFANNVGFDLGEALDHKLDLVEKKYPAEKFNGEHNEEFYREQKAKYRET